MKVKVTKRMVKALNSALKKRKNAGIYTSIFDFDFATMTDTAYGWYVGDIFNAYDWGDWDIETSKFKAIAVEYDENCYSEPHYLTTAELNNCFKHSDKTFDGFINAVFDACEI